MLANTLKVGLASFYWYVY